MNTGIATLIVEDDPMVLEINRQYVENVGGFEVVGTAETGWQALALVRRLEPELVILDVYLPDLDGVKALQEIRRLQLPIDVILVTAARDVETIQNVFRYGALDYITKPFKYDRLKSSLESYKALRSKFEAKKALNQEEIDRLKAPPNRAGDVLPKGLAEITLRQVMLCLVKEDRGLSAEEVAERVGLARVTARRYLDHLLRCGRVELLVRYGAVGRPVNRYRVR